jgi:hypothetical protein
MAKKIKAQPRARKAALPKEKAQKLLAKVPAEYVFWCKDGPTFSDLADMAAGLATMSDDIFAYHVRADNNDFHNWVRDVVEDQELSAELLAATSRLQALERVNSRLMVLNEILTQ